uniref:C2H2-type domain-containing protein n=1 Tax=Coccolithus braarudii TaxID=221442 RepID=A0A7S0LT82_9EUKA|mmetsp:Transcript_940/g.1903  ORF Transcript_940/g.1903 Transcript_940/m.1903 type:complete len:139 (+) Transcript_940:65-481(+)|eukprot:CAMPEP_0183330704 /NCGR_PEP_ID=MMETSP0164_2-20130417/112_1 /TAXON_ID=221442 /ORGANISM="Coccolithus pelagicus ssp braarudi, Strain PLY182g" /LENGTH=138 /DNA_ID=CAMNT_0025498951 /DNA_START=67 /DNA_END=483 /DNA_ORIENTATION=+
MGGKAKPKKHTAAELNAKAAAHKPQGGGSAGMAERTIKIKFTCEVCKAQMPSITNLRVHYEAKHPKDAFPEEQYCQQVETKEKVAVHHNQMATIKSNKNASKSVRDKVKAIQQEAAVVDEAKRKVYTHTAAGRGPSTL